MVDFNSKGLTYFYESTLQFLLVSNITGIIGIQKSQHFYSQFSTHAHYLLTLFPYFNLLEIVLVPFHSPPPPPTFIFFFLFEAGVNSEKKYTSIVRNMPKLKY